MLDPRAKLVIVLVISTLSIIIDDVYFMLGLLILTAILLNLFQVDLLSLYSKLQRFIPLFFALILLQSIFSPSGAPVVTAGRLPLITIGGMFKGILIVLRMFAIIAGAMILTTSTYSQIIMGLVKLKIPYEIAFMVLLAIRFLPTLTEEFSDALTAIQLRGVRVDKTPFGRKLKIYTYILMPVVAGAILRAKKVATVMETRAFRAYPKRTYVEDICITGKDYAAIFTALLLGVTYYVFYIIRG